MRAGILTFQNAVNYGAVLQTYALQRYVSSLGHDTEVIDYRCPFLDHRRYQRTNAWRATKSIGKQFLLRKKKAEFESFRKEHIPLSTPVTRETIKDLCARYDAIIVGSDQVWNTSLTGFDKSYFLDFVDEQQVSVKIAYAVSLGTLGASSDDKLSIASMINSFEHVSVREKSAIETLKGIGVTRDIQAVADPTLLVDTDAWQSLIDSQHEQSDRYVLVYSLGGTDVLIQAAKAYATKAGCGVVCVANGRVGDSSVIRRRNVSPIEWLSLIANAEHVFTSSYHGMCLSIALERPVAFYPSKDEVSNARLLDLASALGCESMRLSSSGSMACNEADYQKIQSRLSMLRSSSRKYLDNALRTFVTDEGTVG